LVLATRDMTDEVASAFLRCPRFPGLTRLQLGESYLGDPTLGALADARHLTRLAALDCTGIFDDEGHSMRLTPAGVAALAEAPHLAGLRDLSLPRTPVEDAGAVALARSPHLRRLEKLAVYDCHFSNAGVEALANSPVLDGVRHLAISCNVHV